MKKYLLLVLIVTLLLVTACKEDTTENAYSNEEKQILTVGFDQDFPPKDLLVMMVNSLDLT